MLADWYVRKELRWNVWKECVHEKPLWFDALELAIKMKPNMMRPPIMKIKIITMRTTYIKKRTMVNTTGVWTSITGVLTAIHSF